MSDPAGARRDGVAALVTETLAAARALERALTEERRALERQQPDALSAATAAKATAVAALERLEERRRTLCREVDHPTPPARMPALLSRCGAPARALADWRELLGVLEAAARLNAANGAVIHLRREQVAGALSILRGASAGAGDTYGPAGARAPGTARRELAQA
jgi:flagellar biosynthesis/type III secretory pathway chaperone